MEVVFITTGMTNNPNFPLRVNKRQLAFNRVQSNTQANFNTFNLVTDETLVFLLESCLLRHASVCSTLE